MPAIVTRYFDNWWTSTPGQSTSLAVTSRTSEEGRTVAEELGSSISYEESVRSIAEKNATSGDVVSSSTAWYREKEYTVATQEYKSSALLFTVATERERNGFTANTLSYSGLSTADESWYDVGRLTQSPAMLSAKSFSPGFNSTMKSSSATQPDMYWNMTNATGPTPVDVDRSAIRTLGIVIGMVDIVLGSAGNLLTICAILSNRKLQTTFHIFIANLCVIDFLTASTMMPFNVTSYWTQKWPFGDDSFSCSFMAFSYYCCGYSSIVCLLVITFNRYVGIVRPKSYDDIFSRRRIVLIIAVSWVFAPAFMAPFFFFSENTGFGWIPQLTLCVFRTDRYNQRQHYYMQFLRVLFQFLPLLIMVVLYVRIFRTSTRSGKMWITLSKRSAENVQARIRPDSTNLNGSRRSTPSPISTTGRYSYHEKGRDDNPLKVNAVITTASRDQRNKHANRFSRTSVLVSVSSETPGLMAALPFISPDQCNNLADDIQMYQPTEDCNSVPDDDADKEVAAPVQNGQTVEEKKGKAESKQGRRAIDTPTFIRKNLKAFNVLGLKPRPFRAKRTYTASQIEAKKRKVLDRRLLRITVTICITFMVLFLPSVIVNLIPKSTGVDPRVHMFASVITWLNSCVNPIVYCFLNKKMRTQYKLLLLRVWNSVFPCWKIAYQLPLQRRCSRGSLHSSFHSSRRRFSHGQ